MSRGVYEDPHRAWRLHVAVAPLRAERHPLGPSQIEKILDEDPCINRQYALLEHVSSITSRLPSESLQALGPAYFPRSPEPGRRDAVAEKLDADRVIEQPSTGPALAAGAGVGPIRRRVRKPIRRNPIVIVRVYISTII